MMAQTRVAVLWPKVTSQDILEVQFSHDFCRRTSRKLCSTLKTSASEWIEYTTDTSLEEIRLRHSAEMLLAVTDPEIVLPSHAFECLAKAAGCGAAAWGPVFNQTPFPDQIAELPASYVNITSFLEISERLAGHSGETISAVETLDPSCVMIRPEALFNMDVRLSFREGVTMLAARSDVPFSAVKGALVHRFGDYYGGEREDLVRLVPMSVKRVLDIGCAKGMYGKKLKEVRPGIVLTGVELNPVMAAQAQKYYDDVHTCRVEDASLPNDFDLVNCGDVLEHLQDPLGTLSRLGDFLKPGGRLVTSVPNVGHWSVVKDLLRGKFEYIPVGLLCISHIRWFTEGSLREILGRSGFTVEAFYRETIPATPEGEAFIRKVCQDGLADEASLRTNEFIVRAIKA